VVRISKYRRNVIAVTRLDPLSLDNLVGGFSVLVVLVLLDVLKR